MDPLGELTRDVDVAWVMKLVSSYGYVSLVVGSVLEGPFVMATCGLLVKLGVFSFWPAYIALNCGDLLADIFWYRVGYKLGTAELTRRYARHGITSDTLGRIGKAFHRYQTAVLIASKLTCGFGVLAIPIIVAAGVYKIPFWRFLTIYALAGCVWTLVPMGVGFYFGIQYGAVETVLGKAVLVLVLLCVTGVCFRLLLPMLGQLIGRYFVPQKR